MMSLLSVMILIISFGRVAGDTYQILNSPTITKPGCPSQCGNLTVPYPFGIGSGCGINESFEFTCTAPYKGRPRLLFDTNQIYNISDQHMRIFNVVARTCHNYSTVDTDPGYYSAFSSTIGTTFSYSDLNKLTVVGCNDMGVVSSVINGFAKPRQAPGCISVCMNARDVIGGNCSGSGCCQASFPKGLKSYFIMLIPAEKKISLLANTSFNPCSHVFFGEEDRFVFRGLSDLSDPHFRKRIQATVPIVLDWAIGNLTCAQVESSRDYACKGNTFCVDMDTGFNGYRCTCKNGFQGNPYLDPGCTDIDECSNPNLNNCDKVCINTLGSFNCSCPQGFSGDGRIDSTGCIVISSQFPVIKVALGSGFGFLGVITAVTWIYFGFKKRKLLKLRVKFFQQNGGYLLKQQISSSEGPMNSTKIFTSEELEKATNNYADDKILGKGGYSIVYKGVLPDKHIVAIKKSRVLEENQIEQFINEVVILTQVNHRNVVKLLGCCLESETPLLVYEYVSHGTLFEHIHSGTSWLSWENRLRIASEAAGALSYLHSAVAIPVIHRDVKSANILVDEYLTAKISDFGASRLISLDQTEVTTLVQGTLGYLDPEYFHTSLLTEKSDVYSFGVVLAELLTGKRPIDMEMSQDQRNLTIYFVTAMKENRLFQVLEPRVVREGSLEQIQAVAELIKKCLHLNGEDRPSMKEVTMELEGLRNFNKHPWANQPVVIQEESVGLMNDTFESNDLYTTSITSTDL